MVDTETEIPLIFLMLCTCVVFGVANYKSEILFSKLEAANSIWRSLHKKIDKYFRYFVAWDRFEVASYESEIRFSKFKMAHQ